MRRLTLPVTTIGADAVAAGNANAYVREGRLVGAKVDYAAGQPATTTVTVTADGISLFTLSAQATDRLIHPLHVAQDRAGADIVGSTVEPVVTGRVNVEVTGANAASPAVIVSLILE